MVDPDRQNPEDQYDWTKDPDEMDFADPFQEGPHLARVVQLRYTSRDKPEGFTTRNGDPYFLLVVENGHGQQGVITLTCTKKAGWMIRKTLSAAGADMADIQSKGVQPEDFRYEDVAKPYFEGATFWVNATERTGTSYMDLEPMSEGKIRAKVDEFFGLGGDEAAITAKLAELKALLQPV